MSLWFSRVSNKSGGGRIALVGASPASYSSLRDPRFALFAFNSLVSLLDSPGESREGVGDKWKDESDADG